MSLIFLAGSVAAGAQQRFDTPEQAAAELVAAARTDDRARLLTILGPDGADIISSGDDVDDAAARRRFIEAYDERHQVERTAQDAAALVLGKEDLLFPIPLIQRNAKWQFNTAAGREEIFYRRIGRNELNAIKTCLAYFDAQHEYAEMTHAARGVAVYAQRILSQAGKKDGLYWPTQPGERESPLGDLIAGAASEGYRVGATPAPFHGYYYKILRRQGRDAPGGAYDYVVRGEMIGGFALVAYPAEYRKTGVTTFLVNHDGVVFEKDLGPNTRRLAEGMTTFNPDNTWRKIDVPR